MPNKTIIVLATGFFILSIVFQSGDCTNITQAESLYNMLFTNYNLYMFPVLDLDDPIVVEVKVGVIGVSKFDEINGEIDITFVFHLQWVDERLTWTPSEYGGKTSLLIPADVVWYPKLYLIQSFERIQVIGNMSNLVRILSNGTVIWSPLSVLKVICSVDVTYFPFDTQTCPLSLSTWMYTKDEMRFVISDTDLDLSLSTANSQWDLQSGSVSNATDIPSPFDIVNVQLTLRRRSDFFVVYIICPIVFLGCINNLVFVMPASSGERTSVAITAFLSFIVFMEMVNSNVPESSSPLAYIYYYILFLLTYSSTILFLCIISLRIHDRDGEVPPKVLKIAKWLMFWRIKCRKKTISPTKDNGNDNDHDDLDKVEFEREGVVLSDTNEITWKIVGKTFDKYCLCTLFAVYVIYTLLTFSRLYTNVGL